MDVLKQIFLSSLFLILLDLLYYILTKSYYINKIEEIQKEEFQFRISGVIIRYFFIILGLTYFILQKKYSLKDAFILGIVFGGIFNGTMYSSFINWDARGAFIDTLWLGLLFSLTTYLTSL